MSQTAEVKTIALLNEDQVALILNMRVTSLRNWRYQGRGPKFLKVGSRTVRYRPEAVEEFLSKGEAGHGGGNGSVA